VDDREKASIALSALDEHEVVYEMPVPERLVRFFRTGDAFTHNKKCFFPDPDVKIPGHASVGSFRLIVTVPSWVSQAGFGACDESVVGRLGDWIHVHKCIPIFTLNEHAFIVARLDDPKCPVGYFEERCWNRTASDEGVYALAASLDEFLVELVSLDDADIEAADASDEIWSFAAMSLKGDASEAASRPHSRSRSIQRSF
jgi:hypothetical protein